VEKRAHCPGGRIGAGDAGSRNISISITISDGTAMKEEMACNRVGRSLPSLSCMSLIEQQQWCRDSERKNAMEEYLTTDELCDRIKYQKQTIYNLIHRKVFVAGKHFLKPTPKKILFKWSEIQTWIGDDSGLVQ
jgi:hypothetical protein